VRFYVLWGEWRDDYLTFFLENERKIEVVLGEIEEFLFGV